MLGDFRTIRRNWDKATDVIREEIVLSSSDERGRKIEIHVTDNGQVVDLTGVGLNLFWETKGKHYNGLDNFDAVDIKKGVYEIYPTTGMLSNVGELNAWLYLVTMDGEAITSVKLPIRIEGGINTEAVESSNSFSLLTKALGKVVDINSSEQERQENEQARIEAEAKRDRDYASAEMSRDGQYSNAEYSRDELYEAAEQVRDDDYASRLEDLEVVSTGGGVELITLSEDYDSSRDSVVNLGYKPSLVEVSGTIRGTHYFSDGYFDSEQNVSRFRTFNDNYDSSSTTCIAFQDNLVDKTTAKGIITENGFKLEWNVEGSLSQMGGDRELMIVVHK